MSLFRVPGFYQRVDQIKLDLDTDFGPTAALSGTEASAAIMAVTMNPLQESGGGQPQQSQAPPPPSQEQQAALPVDWKMSWPLVVGDGVEASQPSTTRYPHPPGYPDLPYQDIPLVAE